MNKWLIGLVVVLVGIIVIVLGSIWISSYYQSPECIEKEKLYNDAIGKANYCETDEDCLAVFLGPLCDYKAINKNEKEKISQLAYDYYNACSGFGKGPMGQYSCKAALEVITKCENKTCKIVETREIT